MKQPFRSHACRWLLAAVTGAVSSWAQGAPAVAKPADPANQSPLSHFFIAPTRLVRHSLCHGWASGPTAFLSQTVLGVKPLEPGFKRVRGAPQLGNLQWVEGDYPTPLGVVHVRHERRADGTIKSKITAPRGMKVQK